ncbi:MAG: hypothetical protein GY929_04110 [Actinomycetia bacterium]|nr:hypothetical protein [Actinomycetes bacterium]
MVDQISWYLARAGGMAAWWLTGISIIWGILLGTRLLGRRPTGPWLLDVHRFAGGLAVVFSILHLVGLWADDYVEFGPAELFIPMASTWRPGAVAWGVVAFWLLTALEVTSLLKRRVPERLWRWVHSMAAPVFVLGAIHGLQAGSDVSNPVVWWSGAALVTAVLGLLGFRIATIGVDIRPSSGAGVKRVRPRRPPQPVGDDRLPV